MRLTNADLQVEREEYLGRRVREELVDAIIRAPVHEDHKKRLQRSCRPSRRGWKQPEREDAIETTRRP